VINIKAARPLEREITFPSPDRGLPAATWVVTITQHGLSFRRKGEREQFSATWRSILGNVLVHRR
jgi:hypothetical protein